MARAEGCTRCVARGPGIHNGRRQSRLSEFKSGRSARGQVRHVIANAEAAAKFADLPGEYTRIVVGQELEGWTSFEKGYAASTRFTPEGETRANDPLLLYFTSGTTAQPKLVLHSHQSYPVGHLSTMYWLGLRPGDLHLNISSP